MEACMKKSASETDTSLARSPRRLSKPLFTRKPPPVRPRILGMYGHQGCLAGTPLSRYDWTLRESIEGGLKYSDLSPLTNMNRATRSRRRSVCCEHRGLEAGHGTKVFYNFKSDENLLKLRQSVFELLSVTFLTTTPISEVVSHIYALPGDDIHVTTTV